MIENARIPQPPTDSGVEQFVVRDAAPEKERQTRGQLDVGETIGAPLSCFVGIGFYPKQEIGADENPLERGANAGVEVAIGSSALVKAQERLDILFGRRPPIRTSSQRREDLGRASLVRLDGGLRMAPEDAAAARRIPRHAAVVRPSNQQRRYGERRAGDIGIPAPNRDARRAQPLGLDSVRLDGGGDHLPQPGCERNTDL